MQSRLIHLNDIATKLNVYDIAQTVIGNEKFSIWTGSGEKGKHHYGSGGLLCHTMEVVDLCLQNAQYITDLYHYHIDRQKLFLAALFHDIGKIYDYELIIIDSDVWRKANHAREIHHISRSALIWNEAKIKFNFVDEHDEVLHAILSHHGRREYGSPVSPSTRIAWLLHLCDSISARMFDCNVFQYDDSLKL